MSQTTEQQRLRRERSRGHVIEDVRFSETFAKGLPSSAAPIRCSCGETTTSGEWDRHGGPSEYMQAKAATR